MSILSEFGTVYRQALLVLNHYCRSKISWVMPTSVYTPNTDRYFLLSLYLVFKLRLFLCVLLLYDVFADRVACKWRSCPLSR